MTPGLRELAYLAAAVTFVLGLRGLCHPRTAARGNTLAAAGMLLAVVVTLLDQRMVNWTTVVAGLAVGGAAGTWIALRAPLTAMPQVVAAFNGFGGAASAIAVGAALEEARVGAAGQAWSLQHALAGALTGWVGAVALTGSGVAFGKLQGWLPDRPMVWPGRHAVTALLVVACLALAAWQVGAGDTATPFWVLAATAALLGATLVLAVGGADMPVVISLLNALSGLAAAGVGWVLGNSLLIIAGALVGAAGLVLTGQMCRAMNRALANVLFGAVGASAPGQDDAVYAGRIKRTAAAEVASLLDAARRVVIVPGYGLAAAQAQHAVRDLARALAARGTRVDFAVHPVAGRMPGHMNVLLAEAEIPYDQLFDRDAINDAWPQVDVALVVGANDVVNPLAREREAGNPLAGMPILDVDRARAVVVIKRGLGAGFAGVPNPLFAGDHTLMLFDDAKAALTAIGRELADDG